MVSTEVELLPIANKELSILQDVRSRVLNLFTNPQEKELAKLALFDHLYTDPDSKVEYSAPNTHALPYLLQILAEEQKIDSGELSKSLYTVPIDVRNIRRANDQTGTENAGDLAIAQNLASLIATDAQGKLSSIAVRYSGDELLAITTFNDLAPLHEKAKDIQPLLIKKYPILKNIICNPEYKVDIPIRISQVNLDVERDVDYAERLYHPGTDDKYYDNSKQLSDYIFPDLENITIDDQRLLQVPLSIRNLVAQSGNTERAKILALHTTYNEMYPRNENVFNHSQFFAATQEKIARNPDKKYRLIMLGPIGIKELNSNSHADGDDILINTNHIIRNTWPDAIVTQDRGSFIAWIEDNEKFEMKVANINKSITDEKILHVKKNIYEPAIAVTTFALEDNQSTDVEKFWEKIDNQRPMHYLHETQLFLENLSHKGLWKTFRTRLTSRVDQVRNMVLGSAMRITPIDIELLSGRPTDCNNLEEFTEYLGSLSNLIARLDWPNARLLPPKRPSLSSSA